MQPSKTNVHYLLLNDLYANISWWDTHIQPQIRKANHILILGNWLNVLAQTNLIAANHEIVSRIANLADHTSLHIGLGPNEILALNHPQDIIGPEDVAAIINLPLSPASAIENLLCTYGGLTYDQWRRIGEPQTAKEAVQAIGEYLILPYPGPAYRFTGSATFNASPILAAPWYETLPSWQRAPQSCPFPQLFAQRLTPIPDHIPTIKLNAHDSAETLMINGQHFTGINKVGLPYLTEAPEAYPEYTWLMVEDHGVSPM